MPRRSAGILMHRRVGDVLEVLLVHPGGPFWRGRDLGAWQIPKGAVEPGEDDEAAARREVAEELGVAIEGDILPLGEIIQAGGKVVVAFAAERQLDPRAIVSNTVEIDWPPRSGRRLTVPEVDEAKWFGIDEARRRMLKSQIPLLGKLIEATQAGDVSRTEHSSG